MIRLYAVGVGQMYSSTSCPSNRSIGLRVTELACATIEEVISRTTSVNGNVTKDALRATYHETIALSWLVSAEHI
jgi:hypothetical protein